MPIYPDGLVARHNKEQEGRGVNEGALAHRVEGALAQSVARSEMRSLRWQGWSDEMEERLEMDK